MWASIIVWPDRLLGQMTENNIVWSTDDDIVWGTLGDDIARGTWALEDIVWGVDDNVVHRTDNIVWGTALGWGGVF